MMEIILIRHGRPEFELKGKARAREVQNIIQPQQQKQEDLSVKGLNSSLKEFQESV